MMDDEMAVPELLTEIIREICGRIRRNEEGEGHEDYGRKYGASYSSEVFVIHPFCWCEEDTCGWCGVDELPNFHHIPTDTKVWWYKYIGRGMKCNRKVSGEECSQILSEAVERIFAGEQGGDESAKEAGS